MTTDIKDILGDYRAFFGDLRARLTAAGIEIGGCPVSHLAFRTTTDGEYLLVRERLRPHCVGEVENVWNGRPIGKLLLTRPLGLDGEFTAPLIELLPPPHRQPFPMGLEHVGIVIGGHFDAFCEKHDAVLGGPQDQGPYCQPVYITFPNDRTVKFYRHSLKDVVEMEGRRFLPPPSASRVSARASSGQTSGYPAHKGN
jgi:predicted metalloenzyme YecM